ncbi:carotenoid biosynthesis protein [Antrihabitans spumae]|jgi:uncharacterized membrane protein|uniref:Carotenoid biosynthesis protein n=1 Tax=Antrihabitans spumae TaxID=3373370 RepID=A0ABW7KJC2_9NOCA
MTLTQRIPTGLAVATIAAQIAYPLTDGDVRDRVTMAVVALFASTCLSHAVLVRGTAWTLGFLLCTGGLGLAVEMLGTATGFPFGPYDYAVGRLGNTVGGVPLAVALAWTAGIYTVWTVATILFRRNGLQIVATGFGAVGWDLYLDPQMVADGQWTWHSEMAGLPGLGHIPVTNYLGWFAVAVTMAFAISRLPRSDVPDVPDRMLAVPIALFVWTWLGSALAHAVFLSAPELRFSAIYGLVVMGVLGVPLLARIAPEVAARVTSYAELRDRAPKNR